MEKKTIKPFLVLWGCVVFALAIISVIFYFVETKFELLHTLWFLELLLVAFATLGIYYFMWKKQDANPRKFITSYQSLKMVKLFIFIGVMVLYVFLSKKGDAMSFLVDFMVYYIGIGVVEAIGINKLSKENLNTADEK
ncbi:hypothetical protein FACS1894153_3470 [Bacteroidia bacterium]|nr:hypothetical protein FACS1894153_3470 [Bacteroidia bacterium]